MLGEPTSLSEARQLAHDDRYQFQWWALSLVKAKPLGGEAGGKSGKKGKDRGMDGVINFIDDPKGRLSAAVVQVKSGHVKSGDIRDLVGTVQAEKAAMGVFLTLEPPTEEMKAEASKAGCYTSAVWGQSYPKIQVLTIDALLGGAQVQMPPEASTFAKAQKVKGNQAKQGELGL